MKKYALFAIPSLAALILLLVWLTQKSAQVNPPESIAIPQVITAVETVAEFAAENDPSLNVTLEKPQIAEANSETTSILENTQDEDLAEEISQIQPEASDDGLKDYVASKLDSKLNRWFVSEHILSKFVRAVNALEEGKLVSKYRPLEMPLEAFSAQKNGDKLFISQDNYKRYTPYISALENIGEDALVAAYKHYYPALNHAYEELGVDKGDFDEVSKRALKQLLVSPQITISPELNHKSVMYKYNDPRLEALPSIQKLMIRMGPENSLRLKALIEKVIDKM